MCALAGLGPVQSLLDVEWKSEVVGLATTALAVLGMVVGSLVFPDSARERS